MFNSSNITAYVQENTDLTNLTFALRAPDEADPYQWKRFNNSPTLTVTYAFPVGVPTGLTLTNSLKCDSRLYARTSTPTFTAIGHEYNSNGALPLEVQFEILDSGGAIVKSGVQAGTRDKTLSWTSTSLDGGDHLVRARTKTTANDGTDITSAWTSNLPFTVDTTAPPVPSVKSFTHPLGFNETSGTLEKVPGDKTSGSFTLTSTDSRVTGFAYAFNNSSVPAPTGANCLTSAGPTNPDGTQGFIKASGGTAALPLPAAVTGDSYLRVRAIDEAGNVSPVTASYGFVRPATATSY